MTGRAQDRLRERLAKNAASIDGAKHHKETWTQEQDEILELWHAGDEDELVVLSELLGRTIEACRQRFYLLGRETPEEREARRAHERELLATRETPGASRPTKQGERKLSQAAWDPEERSDWYV